MQNEFVIIAAVAARCVCVCTHENIKKRRRKSAKNTQTPIGSNLIRMHFSHFDARHVHCCYEYFVPLVAIIRHPSSVMAIYHQTNYKFTHGRMRHYANWLLSYVMSILRRAAKGPISILHSCLLTNTVLDIVCERSASHVPAYAIQTIRCHWHRQNSISVITWTLILRHQIVCHHNNDAPDHINVISTTDHTDRMVRGRETEEGRKRGERWHLDQNYFFFSFSFRFFLYIFLTKCIIIYNFITKFASG